jgi:hypothetical protein
VGPANADRRDDRQFYIKVSRAHSSQLKAKG